MSKRQNKKRSNDERIAKLTIIASIVNLIVALINLLSEMLRRL